MLSLKHDPSDIYNFSANFCWDTHHVRSFSSEGSFSSSQRDRRTSRGCTVLLSLVPGHQSQMDDEATEEDTLSSRAACWFKSTLEMRMLLWNVHLTR